MAIMVEHSGSTNNHNNQQPYHPHANNCCSHKNKSHSKNNNTHLNSCHHSSCLSCRHSIFNQYKTVYISGRAILVWNGAIWWIVQFRKQSVLLGSGLHALTTAVYR
uniref:Uncharacterized protein n=1 Tax=Populus davidiana TaxID=266767 RepID=A0A6M2ECP6_9ROSI